MILTTDEERSSIIIDAVKFTTEKGIKLGPESWGIGWNRNQDRYTPTNAKICCPLAAVVLAFQDSLPRHLDYREWTIETLLSVDSAWIKGFIAGFDNKLYDRSTNREAFLIGLKMREYLKI
jgi:hypothetical protein